MLSTLYGDIDYNDHESVKDWLQAHQIAHRQYREGALDRGINLQSPVLAESEVDADWFARHGLNHIGLQRVYSNANSTGPTFLLEGSEMWKNERNFYDWHQLHNEIHQRINAALGIG